MNLSETQRKELQEWAEILAAGLTREEVEFLGRCLLALTNREDPPEPTAKAGRAVVEQRRLGGVTLQLERVRCGKGCKKCPHGPYWYAYWRDGGKMKSRYIGKEWGQARGFAESVQAQGRKVGGQAAGDLTA